MARGVWPWLLKRMETVLVTAGGRVAFPLISLLRLLNSYFIPAPQVRTPCPLWLTCRIGAPRRAGGEKIKICFRTVRLPPRLRSISKPIASTNGTGPRQVYLDVSSPECEQSPPPVVGGIEDSDVITRNHGFSTNQVIPVPPRGMEEESLL